MQRSTACAGIAALTVFAIHVWIYQLPNTVELRARLVGEDCCCSRAASRSVMFFVLSGYLLYRAFARAALREGRAGQRGAAISCAAPPGSAPAYYVAILGTLALL